MGTFLISISFLGGPIGLRLALKPNLRAIKTPNPFSFRWYSAPMFEAKWICHEPGREKKVNMGHLARFSIFTPMPGSLARTNQYVLGVVDRVRSQFLLVPPLQYDGVCQRFSSSKR